VRFGPQRTLNLRTGLPSAADAMRRAENWLRQQQVAQDREGADVLVITGRGRGSIDGVPVIREAALDLFARLKRHGVITDVREHNAGSFVVRLASLRSLVDAPKRRHHHVIRPARDPESLRGLDVETRAQLRRLAHVALDHLGVREPTPTLVADEMVRQLSHLAEGLPAGENRETALRRGLSHALEEYE
jgi:hypothetical protein